MQRTAQAGIGRGAEAQGRRRYARGCLWGGRNGRVCLSQEGTRGKRESLSYSEDLQGQPCFLMVPGVQNINHVGRCDQRRSRGRGDHKHP